MDLTRFRIHFHKTAAMRFTGHLDLHRAWERLFRRARLPVAFSQGFHPQPRFHLACALPLGATSQAEILDVWLEAPLEAPLSPETVVSALEEKLPPGIRLGEIKIADLSEPSLQTQVQSAEYQITLLEPLPNLTGKIAELLQAASLRRQRRGKPYDLRPLVEQLAILEPDGMGQARLFARLAAREGATGRPDELLDALGYDPLAARVHRTALIFPA